MQRKFERPKANPPQSTSLTRWRAGHMVRLFSATAVGMWALLLSIFNAPLWTADLLFALGILLLLIWRPDAAPRAQGEGIAKSNQ